MPIQTSYPFNYSYPKLGQVQGSIHSREIVTGLVAETSPSISFGTAVEGSLSQAAGASVMAGQSRYQRYIVQRAGAAIIAGATFKGIALHEDKQPLGSPQAFHTELVDNTIAAQYYPSDDVKLLRKGKTWVEFDAVVTNANPEALIINYFISGLNVGKFTLTSNATTAVATGVKLLQPTYSSSGKQIGLVEITL